MFKISYSFPEALTVVQQHQQAPSLVLKKGDIDARYVVIYHKDTLLGKIHNVFHTIIALIIGYRKTNLQELRPNLPLVHLQPQAAQVPPRIQAQEPFVVHAVAPLAKKFTPRQIAAIKSQLQDVLSQLSTLGYRFHVDYDLKRQLEARVQFLIDQSSTSQSMYLDEIASMLSSSYSLIRSSNHDTNRANNPFVPLYAFTHEGKVITRLKSPESIDVAELRLYLEPIVNKYDSNFKIAQQTSSKNLSLYIDINDAITGLNKFIKNQEPLNPLKLNQIERTLKMLTTLPLNLDLDAAFALTCIENNDTLASLVY